MSARRVHAPNLNYLGLVTESPLNNGLTASFSCDVTTVARGGWLNVLIEGKRGGVKAALSLTTEDALALQEYLVDVLVSVMHEQHLQAERSDPAWERQFESLTGTFPSGHARNS